MEKPPTTARGQCFIDGDEGLTSVVAMESVAFSGSHIAHHHHPVLSRMVGPKHQESIRNIANLSSAGFPVTTAGYGCSSAKLYRVLSRFEEVNQQPHYFLEACFLCKKYLSNNRDIFMYRGDTPFCSEECRQEQIEMDEAKEKKWNLSAAMKAMRSKKKDSASQKSSSSSYRAGTVAAA